MVLFLPPMQLANFKSVTHYWSLYGKVEVSRPDVPKKHISREVNYS